MFYKSVIINKNIIFPHFQNKVYKKFKQYNNNNDNNMKKNNNSKKKMNKKRYGSFHAQCKKTEKIKNDDLDLFYVYFSSIMSYEYPFIEKTAQNSPKKKNSDVFTRSLDSKHSRWDRYV